MRAFSASDSHETLQVIVYCRREREAFHERILEARMHPTKAMSINIDGMDQQTTHVPSFSYRDKDTEDCLIQVHLTGRMRFDLIRSVPCRFPIYQAVPHLYYIYLLFLFSWFSFFLVFLLFLVQSFLFHAHLYSYKFQELSTTVRRNCSMRTCASVAKVPILAVLRSSTSLSNMSSCMASCHRSCWSRATTPLVITRTARPCGFWRIWCRSEFLNRFVLLFSRKKSFLYRCRTVLTVLEPSFTSMIVTGEGLLCLGLGSGSGWGILGIFRRKVRVPVWVFKIAEFPPSGIPYGAVPELHLPDKRHVASYVSGHIFVPTGRTHPQRRGRRVWYHISASEDG